VYSIVPHVQDAEDIFQETCEVICEKFDAFRDGGDGSDFLAWARQIAWWRVRAARTVFARSKRMLSENVMQLIAGTAESMQEELGARGEALEVCLQKLPPRDRELITARYQQGVSVEEAARRNGRSLEAAYKALMRIRRVLHECVSRQVPEVAP
jgi:RNA polymerase sigma-70 factor (ECF subfamily)